MAIKYIRTDGSYAIENDNKVRVEKDGESHSVLFEDIASISVIKVGNPAIPNYLMGLGAGFIIFVITAFMQILTDLDALIVGVIGFFLGAIAAAVVALLFKSNAEVWDNVVIETRGGKKIFYSVDMGMGKNDMDIIEAEKRKNSEFD